MTRELLDFFLNLDVSRKGSLWSKSEAAADHKTPENLNLQSLL